MQKETAILVAPGCRGHLFSEEFFAKSPDDNLSRGRFPSFKNGRGKLTAIRCATGNELKPKTEAFNAFILATVEVRISGRRFLLAPAEVFAAGVRVEIPVLEDETFEVLYEVPGANPRRPFKDLAIKVDLTFEGEEP